MNPIASLALLGMLTFLTAVTVCEDEPKCINSKKVVKILSSSYRSVMLELEDGSVMGCNQCTVMPGDFICVGYTKGSLFGQCFGK